MSGRLVGYPAGGRFNAVRARAWNGLGGYDTRLVNTRLLVHSNYTAIPYPYLPTTTSHFGWDLMPRRDHVSQKTLTSTLHSVWGAQVDDIVIKEVWEAPGGISLQWPFILALHELYLNPPNWLDGESLIWRPLDRNPYTYPVDIVDMVIDSEEFNLKMSGDDPMRLLTAMKRATREKGAPGSNTGRAFFTASKFEIHLVVRPEVAPNANVVLTEGADVDETDQFALE